MTIDNNFVTGQNRFITAKAGYHCTLKLGILLRIQHDQLRYDSRIITNSRVSISSNTYGEMKMIKRRALVAKHATVEHLEK